MSPRFQLFSRVPIRECLSPLIQDLPHRIPEAFSTLRFFGAQFLCLPSEQQTCGTCGFHDFDVVEVRIVILEEISDLPGSIAWGLEWRGHARKGRGEAVVPGVKGDFVEGIDNRAFEVGHELDIRTICNGGSAQGEKDATAEP